MSSAPESRWRMPVLGAGDRFPSEPARRIVIGSLVIFLLLAAAIGVTIWRYESALDQYQRGALDARDDAQRVERAISAFWQEQAAIFSYVAQQSDEVLVQLDHARGNFVRDLSLVHTQSDLERRKKGEAIAANQASISNFLDNVKPALSGEGGQGLVAALEQQNTFGNSVIPPLNQLSAVQTVQAQRAVSQAENAGREALIA